jgi:hypothetical protein
MERWPKALPAASRCAAYCCFNWPLLLPLFEKLVGGHWSGHVTIVFSLVIFDEVTKKYIFLR